VLAAAVAAQRPFHKRSCSGASQIRKYSAKKITPTGDPASYVSNLRSSGAPRTRSSFYAATRPGVGCTKVSALALRSRRIPCCPRAGLEAGAPGMPASVDHLSTGDSQ
jgi:hypothetical protein